MRLHQLSSLIIAKKVWVSCLRSFNSYWIKDESTTLAFNCVLKKNVRKEGRKEERKKGRKTERQKDRKKRKKERKKDKERNNEKYSDGAMRN